MADKSKKQYVRQNKNFLDKPLFTIDEIDANKVRHSWSPIEGFKLETNYKLPAKTDQVILYFLMLRSQELNWRTELVFSKHELLKSCGIPASKKSYARLDDTLKRWFKIEIFYENSFICAEKGNVYKQSGAFHIIEAYDLKTQKQQGRTRVYIRLSPEWLEVVRTHAFFELLDFQVIKRISSPLCLRLYEILSKNFYKRSSWQIDAIKLADMIPLKVRYPAECVNKISPMVKQINKIYGAEIYSLTVNKPARGVAVMIFKKDSKTIAEAPDPPFPGKPAPLPGSKDNAPGYQDIPLPFQNPIIGIEEAKIYLDGLTEDEQKNFMAEFEASLLNDFNLRRYKQRGIDGVKTIFINFYLNHAKQNNYNLQ